MNAIRRIVATAAASALAFSTLIHPAAQAAELTPADLVGDATPATISEEVPPIQPKDPIWRTKVQRAIASPVSEGRIQELEAYSASMGRNIPLVTIKAKSDNAPTYYLLNGAGGGDQPKHDWIANTHVLEYFLNQNVNLVIPMSGMFSYYVDWVDTPNGKLSGEQKWETFLTKELPGPIEHRLNGNGKRAIAGMSMSATSSLLLAEHNPGFYDAVGSFSGCAETSTLLGNTAARLTVQRAGATPEQIWGPMGSETNLHADALVNAEKLRGHALYVSNGSGLIGETDTAGYRQQQKGMSPQAAASGSSTLATEGGAIEGATDLCTHNLAAKLKHLDIPATFNFNNVGTHTWEYWEQDMKRSWEEVINPALNG